MRRTGLPVTGHSGGRTKFNRTRLGIPKSHALDAACVGEMPALKGWRQPVLAIRAMGRGAYARTRVNRSGFPVGHLMAAKSVRGFRTGDIVRATVPSGKKRGVHVGRVAVRRTGSFNVQTARGTVQGISHPLPRRPARRRLRIRPRDVTERGDGNDARNTGARIPPRPEGRGFLREDWMTDVVKRAAELLEPHRATIDRLDTILVYTLAERFACTQAVGKLKAEHKLPPADKTREAEQIKRLEGLAREADLDPEFAKKFLAFITEEVIQHHMKIQK